MLSFLGDDNSVSTRSISPSVSPAPSSIDFVGRCRALYDYSNANMEESQIPMHQGEEFLLIEVFIYDQKMKIILFVFSIW